MDPRDFMRAALEGVHEQRRQLELWANAPTRRVKDLHPAPWSVRKVVDPRYRDILWDPVHDYVVLDAHGKHVCETQDPYVAHAIAVAAQTIGEYPPR